MGMSSHKKELVTLIATKIQKQLDQKSLPPQVMTLIQEYVFTHQMSEQGIEQLKSMVK